MSPHTLRVYYLRSDGNLKDWGLHAWGAGVRESTSWDQALPQTGQNSDGCFWDIQLQSGDEEALQLGLIVHQGDNKSTAIEVQDFDGSKTEVWLVDGVNTILANKGEAKAALQDSKAAGYMLNSSAHWVSDTLLLWRVPKTEGATFSLVSSASAAIKRTATSIDGYDSARSLALLENAESNPQVKAALARFPHLNGCTAFQVEPVSDEAERAVVTGQLCAAMHGPGGDVLDVTMVQLQGYLDERYYYDGPLGDVDGTLTVWAPTAQSVELVRYTTARGDSEETIPMTFSTSGCWTVARPESWDKQYYHYRVTAFHPSMGKMATVLSTDPYSRGLSADGERSMFVDLDSDSELMPHNWLTHAPPPIADPVDTSVYELHIRDFSATDDTVPSHLKGKYLAFDSQSTGGETLGQSHIKRLQAAGLTHIHLLPTYDYGSVPERVEDQLVTPDDLGDYPPDSDYQQLEVSKVASQDAFNWGYDPVHYGVPEGSYSTDPDSPSRLKEFRSMVMALHSEGLRVVLDVVYNHTFASGVNTHSVLDKLVPGYYHRRTETGDYCNSTCCNNTATEHRMCERLMIDDLVHWVKHYRVDGFRFDIMGHIMIPSMNKARAAIDALTLEKDGVDGRAVYLYGEAWDFGEVACNQRGQNASQLNIAGTGLGAFNDRVRDACIGGSPFAPPTLQGFLTGMFLSPNPSHTPATPADLDTLLTYADWLKIGLAGNLRNFPITTMQDEVVEGKNVCMGTIPVAYCDSPAENVIYLGCHDNETLYDNVVLKLAHEGSAEMCARVCQLAHGLVATTQGVAFFHAGDDLLRSKSLDRDSYNSGDWFNRLDWSARTNNFAVGLPIAAKNADHWDIKQPFLAQASLAPSPDVIQETSNFFQAMLRVRYSTNLFRLRTKEAIIEQVAFENCGSKQVPGLLVMHISSSKTPGGCDDPVFKSVTVMLNASPDALVVKYPADIKKLILHRDTADLAHVESSSTNDADCSVNIGARTLLVLCEMK